MKKLIFTFSILYLLISFLPAQVITVSPVFPSVNDTVTITYDATLGNAALEGTTPPIYTHTGLITDKSASPTDWKYVQGNWGTADPTVEMTPLGNDLHQIKYHIKSYYGVPSSDSVEQMAFVFRDESGDIVGRAADGSDMYYPVYPESGLFAKFVLPSKEVGIYKIGDSIQVSCEANKNASLELYQNGNLVASSSNDMLSTVVNVTQTGQHLLELVADDGTQQVRDTVFYVVNPPLNFQDPPPGVQNGINYLNDSTAILQLTAPFKEYVYIIGEFNEWRPHPDYYMNVSEDTTQFWLQISGLEAGREYAFQYLVDGELTIADPYADKVLDPWNDQYISNATYPNLKPYPTGKATHIVSVLETGQTDYEWDINNFTKPKKTDLVVYELLVRDFVHSHRYKTIMDSLDYLEKLGINCIELMPIMEFEGNISWGYNPSFFFAPDKYYGTKNDLKAFIDSCHQRGIAVVLDMVLNHAFGQNSMVRLWWNSAENRPAANNPYFNEEPRHDFNVGYDFNHESPYTKAFSKDVMRYWLDQYHFDGFRFDLSKGFTQKNTLGNTGAWGQYDQGRIDIWKEYADFIWSVDSTAYIILEHFAENAEEKVLSNYGMMIWGNTNYNYNELTMGYLGQSDFSWINYQNRGWDDAHVMGYMESHDEERLMFKNLEFGNSQGSYNVKELATALSRMEMAGAVFFTVPGPKMIWQFGELGYEVSIEQNGRTGPKPIRWYYLDEMRREKLYKTWSAMIRLRTKEPAFETTDFDIKGGGAIKRVRLNHASMNVVAVANGDVTGQTATPGFQHTGWWYDYFSGDSINVTDVSQIMPMEPGEYHIYTDRRLQTPDTDVGLGMTNPPKPMRVHIYPNPASQQVKISTRMEYPGNVSIEILDMAGRLKLKEQRKLPAGEFHLIWNTRGQYGTPVPAGPYLIRLNFDEKVIAKKVMITR